MGAYAKIFGLALIIAAVTAVNAYDYESIIQDVPESDRFDFVKHHIQLGYELSIGKMSKSKLREATELPDDFSIGLYTYAKEEHKIKDEVLLKQLREIVCFEDGTCIDIGDIGVHPTR